ncbi:MAG: hypothetical protein JW839_16095 [Candidatus Lokiarchaeota archaeon]|nr:hypothetical protein [Candidatus Lokiarchaeota archaeon]
MRPAKHQTALTALVCIGLLCISQGCSAAVQSGIVNSIEPVWYKISIENQATLNLQVDATNVTANSTLWVVVAIGMAQNLGETPTVAGDVINSTWNATIVYQHVRTTPLYLLILYFPDENCSTSVAYSINCSHPIVPYSYTQYYNDVIYPDIVNQVTIVAVILGGVAMAITIYLIMRRRKEPSSKLL